MIPGRGPNRAGRLMDGVLREAHARQGPRPGQQVVKRPVISRHPGMYQGNLLPDRHQIEEGARLGVIAGVDQHIAVCRQAEDVVFGEDFDMAFHPDKGIDFFETAFGHGSLGLAQVTFPEEHLVVEVGEGYPGAIHQVDGAQTPGHKIKRGGGGEAASPGDENLGGFEAFLGLPTPPIQGYLAGITGHFGRA